MGPDKTRPPRLHRHAASETAESSGEARAQGAKPPVGKERGKRPEKKEAIEMWVENRSTAKREIPSSWKCPALTTPDRESKFSPAKKERRRTGKEKVREREHPLKRELTFFAGKGG